MFEGRPWLDALVYGLLISVLIPIILGVVSWKKLFFGLGIFVVAETIYFIILTISIWLSIHGGTWLSSVYLIALNDCIAYCSVYYLLLNNSKTKSIIKYSVIALSVYLFSDFMLKSGTELSINLYSLTIETIFINTLTLLFIVRLMFALPFKSLLDNPIFWFGIAKMIPALYSLGLELFQDFLISDNISLYFKFYGLDLALHIIGNLVYTYSIWLSLRYDFSLFKKI